MPFNECAVDLVGPWVVQVQGKPYEFFALTAIDTVTNLVELVRIGSGAASIPEEVSGTIHDTGAN